MFKAKRRLFSRGHLAVASAIVAVSAMTPTFASAQRLFEDWQINPSAPFVAGSATQAIGPLNTTVSGSFTFNPGATSDGTESNTVNYGALLTSGSGSATAASNSSSSAAVGNNVDSPVGASAQYADVLTITGSGPVTISLKEVFDGATSGTNGGFGFTSDYFSSTVFSATLDGSESASGVMTFNPGDQLSISDNVSGGCHISLSAAQGSGTCGFDGSDQLYVNVLTAGGGYIAASGTRYLAAAAENGVPEPAAWALMLLGFGGLGAALRSRRKPAVAAA